jgi:glycine/D-amino acid oxidase-like deaminating enzyme
MPNMQNQEATALVVGSGITGLMTAYLCKVSRLCSSAD